MHRLLSPDSLEPLAAMVDELRRIEGVAEVTTLLDCALVGEPAPDAHGSRSC
jgi:hypothetical protein